MLNALPVGIKFALAFARPGDDLSSFIPAQAAAKNVWIGDGDLGFHSAYPYMKMRRVVIGNVHIDVDAVKFADAGHCPDRLARNLFLCFSIPSCCVYIKLENRFAHANPFK